MHHLAVALEEGQLSGCSKLFKSSHLGDGLGGSKLGFLRSRSFAKTLFLLTSAVTFGNDGCEEAGHVFVPESCRIIVGSLFSGINVLANIGYSIRTETVVNVAFAFGDNLLSGVGATLEVLKRMSAGNDLSSITTKDSSAAGDSTSNQAYSSTASSSFADSLRTLRHRRCVAKIIERVSANFLYDFESLFEKCNKARLCGSFASLNRLKRIRRKAFICYADSFLNRFFHTFLSDVQAILGCQFWYAVFRCGYAEFFEVYDIVCVFNNG